MQDKDPKNKVTSTTESPQSNKDGASVTFDWFRFN